MKRVTIIILFFLSLNLNAQDSTSYIGYYSGEISRINHQKSVNPHKATVIVTDVGITFKSDYGVYERYAGTYDKAMSERMGKGEFAIKLDKSAYDEKGLMIVIIKEYPKSPNSTNENETFYSISVSIREFNKSDTFSIKAQKN